MGIFNSVAVSAIGVVLGLAAGPLPLLTNAEPLGTLRGRVVGPAERPIAGATVTLQRAGDAPGDRTVKTDRSGRFAVRLSPGSWLVRWQARGYYESVPATNDPFPACRSLYPTAEITADRTTHLSLEMLPCAYVEGTVLGVGGKPVAGKKVLLNAGRPAMFVYQLTARTDTAGRFRAELPYSGPETFHLLCPGSGYAAPSEVELDPNKPARRIFRLKPVGSIEGRVLSAPGIDLPPGTGVSLYGGWPYVHANGFEPAEGAVAVGKPHAGVDAAGRFRFESLPGGEYTLSIDGRPEAPVHRLTLRDGERRQGVVLVLSTAR